MIIVKSGTVDWSTIQLWTLLAKGHSTSNFPFIKSLKILGCATNRDVLLYGMQVFKTTLMGGVILKDYVSSLKIESRFLLKARMQLTYKVNSEGKKSIKKGFLLQFLE